MKKFWNLATPTTIDIFGRIGWDVDEEGFKETIESIPGNELTVRINSVGGDVFTGMTIYNLLKDTGKHITVRILGTAASIASVIAMAGDEIEMPINALMMIHNPASFMEGTAEEMQKMAETLKKVRQTIVNVYVERTGNDAKTIEAMMDEETWMGAEEALEAGFCTAVIGKKDDLEPATDDPEPATDDPEPTTDDPEPATDDPEPVVENTWNRFFKF